MMRVKNTHITKANSVTYSTFKKTVQATVSVNGNMVLVPANLLQGHNLGVHNLVLAKDQNLYMNQRLKHYLLDRRVPLSHSKRLAKHVYLLHPHQK